ncbi:glutamate decarboxylase 1-like [Antedon mediterranea]|uniref:glutamate decarboxylase 1-like n=1 Tax=Antedon mediterranea TaxID=105859 RepID=UPI003AF7AE75
MSRRRLMSAEVISDSNRMAGVTERIGSLGLNGSKKDLRERDNERLRRTMSVDDALITQPPQEELQPDYFELYARDLLPAKESGELTGKFLKEVTEQLVEYIQGSFERKNKVIDFMQPSELKEKLHLDLPDKAENLDQILLDIKNTLRYCVITGHPRFFNQLSQGCDVISTAGEWVTAAVNTNMFTYEIAPVFTLIEKATLKKMREFIGYKDGEGIFCPGGAISNLYAVLAARQHRLPQCKRMGLKGMPQLVIFTSVDSHFSFMKAAVICGIGADNVIAVNTDERGKMLVSDLDDKIQQASARGDVPFLVNATGGTTVRGSFDPIQSIADVCEKYNIWLHVDAAWGGGVLLSRRHRHLLDGIERADSVTWNPHKIMGVTLQCSAILLKEDGILMETNSMKANYLFQQDKHYDLEYDTGDKAIQCGRHLDVFKLWLMWRAKGTRGLEAQINKLMDLSQYLQDKLLERPGFQMVFNKPEYCNVCFWYVPPSLRGLPDTRENQLRLHKVAPAIKARMMEHGTTMVGYQPLREKVNFFRMITSNPATTKSDIDFLIEEIERLGKDL